MGKLLDAILVKGLPKKDIKNAHKVDLWAFLWAGSLLAAVISHELLGFTNLVGMVMIAAVNLCCGLMMMRAYRRLLRTLDEMERKVQFDAIALAVGVALLTVGVSSILQTASIIPTFEATWLLSIMAFAYAFGLILGRLRLA